MPTGAASGGSSAAIRAGRAFVEIFGKDNLSKMLTRLQAKVAAFGQFIGKVGSGAMLAGAAMLAPVAALFAGMMEKAKLGMFGERAQEDAERFGAAWTDSLTALQGALVPLLETLTPWAERLGQVVREHAEIVPIVAAVGAGLLAFGLTLKVVGGLVVGLSALIGILKVSLLALLSPIGLVAAAIAGLGVVFATQTNLGREATAEFKAGFLDTAATAQQAWSGIVAAFKKGDLELAMQIVGAALRLEWAKIDEFWTRKWVAFKNNYIGGWHELGAALKSIWNHITTGLETILRMSVEGWVKLINLALGAIARGAAWVLEKAGLDETAKKLRDWKPIGTEWLTDWQKGIDAGHQAEENRIANDLAAKLAENQAFRQSQVAGVEAATAAARAELARLVAAAQAENPDAAEGPRRQVDRALSAVKGAFQAPNFQAALGFGDNVIAKQQLEVQKQQLAEQKELNANIKNIKAPVFW